MFLSIVSGIVFIVVCNFIISFFDPNRNARFIYKHENNIFFCFFFFFGYWGSIILLPLLAFAWYPLWFSLLCYWLFIEKYLGVDTKEPIYNQSLFQRKYGVLFDYISLGFLLAAVIAFVWQIFFN